jgi:hypothetical protein
MRPGRVHRPCPARAARPAGGQSPRRVPDPPMGALPARRVGRWPVVGPGPAGQRGTVARGRGIALRFLFPPGGTKTVSPLPWQGPSPLPQRSAAPCPAGGQSPRPAPDPPMAGASRPPGRALACVVPGPTDLQSTVARGQGKRGSRFLFPPAQTKALSPFQWQGPSPLPQRRAGIRTSRGPKPPASARPAHGGRWPFVVPGPTDLQGTVPRGREKRAAFPGPARRGESTVTASLAGAIAPATTLRRDQDRPGAKAPGQRPTRPRRALRPRRVGRWPSVVPGPAGLRGTVAQGRGKRRAFPSPAHTDESTVTASVAGAIAPATAPR